MINFSSQVKIRIIIEASICSQKTWIKVNIEMLKLSTHIFLDIFCFYSFVGIISRIQHPKDQPTYKENILIEYKHTLIMEAKNTYYVRKKKEKEVHIQTTVISNYVYSGHSYWALHSLGTSCAHTSKPAS